MWSDAARAAAAAARRKGKAAIPDRAAKAKALKEARKYTLSGIHAASGKTLKQKAAGLGLFNRRGVNNVIRMHAQNELDRQASARGQARQTAMHLDAAKKRGHF